MPAAAAVLVELFRAAAASAAASGHAPAGLAVSLPLASIGACMSGFAEPGPQAALVSALRALAPSLAAGYWVDNDAPGAIITAAGGAGGAVLIAGTGSMALYVPPAGAPARGGTVCVGGHGHMMGDEGSAFSLAAAGVRAALAAGDARAARAAAVELQYRLSVRDAAAAAEEAALAREAEGAAAGVAAAAAAGGGGGTGETGGSGGA